MPPLVCLSRPLAFPLDLPGAEIRTGPERGFASRQDALDFVRGCDAFLSWISERINDEFLDAAGPKLKIVANHAVGFDNIDVPACRKRNVVVTITPDAVTEGAADLAWCLLLAAARKLHALEHFARDQTSPHGWKAFGVLGPRDFLGLDIAGKTLLIIGAGRIGYATALRSLGWGMRVLYVARTPKPEFEFAPLNARRVTLDEGLREADFISVHTPLTPETRHLINAGNLKLCKPTAVIVNTARGPVIDEAALAQALKANQLWGAGLDVFENEPTIHPDLLTLDNVVVAPHVGSATHTCRKRMADLCAANIRAVLEGR
ncbi:MAG TPA: D-glycerate dehydrogenase, partial [Phycisphaerales bacterium]|nr:D-glycerate dehydrogenase [Phycisphaerales bacterium]